MPENRRKSEHHPVGRELSALTAALLGLLLMAVPALADWQLVWNDEFNGTAIASNRWTFDIGNGKGGWGNNELEYYTSRPQNAFVSGGMLHIVGRKETYNGFSYTSAKLKTLGRFSQRYGHFEFRAKLPAGQGYWPALWMMPRDSSYGGWAASGEIDVMENQGSAPATVLGTLHFGGSWPDNQQSHGPAFTFPAGDSVTNFHVYALEWATNSMKWYVDGRLYETQTSWWSSGGPYPAPFDQPFYLIMNLAIGGNFGGNPDETTVFPGEVQVDYVRVYDWVAGPAPGVDLTVQDGGNGRALAWPVGILQSASAIAGPWEDVTNANSPFTVLATGQQQFYRVRVPQPQ